MSPSNYSSADQTATWVSRFNLSQWALDHQAFTRYLMIVLMLLGVAAYFQLGQDEDPPFTFRAMVVRAYWPGATAEQVAEQVADRIEKTLQEVPYADKIRSYSKPGETLVIFQLKDSSPAAEVPQIWYTARKKIGDMQATLPQGVVGPFFNDEFGDVFGVNLRLNIQPDEIRTEQRGGDMVPANDDVVVRKDDDAFLEHIDNLDEIRVSVLEEALVVQFHVFQRPDHLRQKSGQHHH